MSPPARFPAPFRTPRRAASGLTLLEALVVLAVLAVVFGIAAINLFQVGDPLGDGVDATSATLRQARARAVATTSAYRVLRSGDGYRAEWALRCSAAAADWTADPALDTDLPRGVTVTAERGGTPLPASAPIACFTSRGYAPDPTTITLEHDGRQRVLELYAGGAVTTP